MTVRQYLGQLNRMKTEIRKEVARLEEMQAAASGISAIRYDKDLVQATPDPDRLCLDIAEYLELETDILRKLAEFRASQDAITRQIITLDCRQMGNLLLAVYVNSRNLTQYADQLGKSYPTIKRWHDKALECFREKYGYLFEDKEEKEND